MVILARWSPPGNEIRVGQESFPAHAVRRIFMRNQPIPRSGLTIHNPAVVTHATFNISVIGN